MVDTPAFALPCPAGPAFWSFQLQENPKKGACVQLHLWGPVTPGQYCSPNSGSEHFHSTLIFFLVPGNPLGHRTTLCEPG